MMIGALIEPVTTAGANSCTFSVAVMLPLIVPPQTTLPTDTSASMVALSPTTSAPLDTISPSMWPSILTVPSYVTTPLNRVPFPKNAMISS